MKHLLLENKVEESDYFDTNQTLVEKPPKKFSLADLKTLNNVGHTKEIEEECLNDNDVCQLVMGNVDEAEKVATNTESSTPKEMT